MNEKTLPRISHVALAIAFLVIASAPGSAYAQVQPDALQRAGYRIFTGDANGDGVVDVLARPRVVVVPIPLDDLDVPIVVPPPSPPFALLSAGGTYTLVAPPTEAILNHPSWVPAPYDLLFGNLNADGNTELVMRGSVTSHPSFVMAIAPSGTPVLRQHLSAATIGVDLGASGSIVSLADVNRDGRADLVVRVNGLISTVRIANADGLFENPNTGRLAAIVAWRAFRTSLDAGDAPSALNLVSVDAVPKYNDAFNSLGEALAGLSQNWSEPRPVNVGSDYVTLLIRDTTGGTTRAHLVTLTFENGRWVVDEL